MLQGDLGHTDLQDDLSFHESTFTEPTTSRKAPSSSPGLPGPVTSSGASSSKRYLWSLAFYSQFFDVDTTSVLARCWAALYPRANFLDVLEGNPDLYGPFWIATTVVFILFCTGTINQYLSSIGEGHFAYDFRLLSGTFECTLNISIIQNLYLTPYRGRGAHLWIYPGHTSSAIPRTEIFRKRLRELA